VTTDVVGVQRPLFIGQGEELWAGEEAFRLLDEIWCLCDGRRYVELRGATSSGKSTVLNLLLGYRATATGDGQITGCAEELRPLPERELAGQQPRLVTVDADRLQSRLNYLRDKGDADVREFEKAAERVRDQLSEEDLDFGRTVSLDQWYEWGFSINFVGPEFHSVVAVDRIIRPIGLPSVALLAEAASGRISFVDVPGTASEMHIVKLMHDALANLRPSIPIRVWDARETDAPPSGDPAEILVINQADALTPLLDQQLDRLQVPDRTARAHKGKLVVMSAAADAPAGFDSRLPDRTAARKALQDLAAAIESAATAAKPRFGELYTALQRTLAHPRGGIGVLAELLEDDLDELSVSREAGAHQAVVRGLATETLQSVARLRANLTGPFDPREAVLHLQAEAEADRRRQVDTARQVARREVYGPPELPAWTGLLGSLDKLDSAIDGLREHLRTADANAKAELGLAGEPTLAAAAEPLLDRFRQLRGASSGDKVSSARMTLVDVARVRAEVVGLLAWTLIGQIENIPLPQFTEADEEVRADYTQARRRRNVLNNAEKWLLPLAEPGRS
jgi:hypothetical protein